MHSALIWACCNETGATVTVAEMVHPRELPDSLPEFFWSHLEKDIELLRKDTGRGLDEAVVLVHLVLKQILTVTPPTGKFSYNMHGIYGICSENLNWPHNQSLPKFGHIVSSALELERFHVHYN